MLAKIRALLSNLLRNSGEKPSSKPPPEPTLEQLQFACNAARDGLWYRDLRPDQESFWVSDKWKAILGYHPEELPHEFDSFTSKIHDDDREQVLSAIKDALEGTASSYHADFRMMTKDNKVIHIESRGSIERDDSGRTIRIAGSHTDVTEEHEGKKALHILDEMKGVFAFAKNEDLQFTYVNQALADAFGLAKGKILGKTDAELNLHVNEVKLFNEKDREAILAAKAKAARQSGPLPPIAQVPVQERIDIAEEYFTDAEGRRRILTTVKKPLLIEGEPPQMLGIALDITNHSEYKCLLDTIIHHSEDAIYIMRFPDGGKASDDDEAVAAIFERVNPRMCGILGIGNENQAIGNTHSEMFDSIDGEHARAAKGDEARLRNTDPDDPDIILNERWVTTADEGGGRHYFLTLKAPILLGERVTGYIVISRDMTKLKRHEELLDEIFDKLPECAFVKDREGRYRKWNKAFENWHKSLNIELKEGLTDTELWKDQPEQAAAYQKKDREVLESGKPAEPYRESQRFPDGRILTILTRKFPLFEGSEGDSETATSVLGIFRPIIEVMEQEKDDFYREMGGAFGHCLKLWALALDGNLKLLERSPRNEDALVRLEAATDFLSELADLSTGFATLSGDLRFKKIKLEEALELCVPNQGDVIHLNRDNTNIEVQLSVPHFVFAVAELMNNAKRYALSQGGRARVDVRVELGEKIFSIHVRDNGPGVDAQVSRVQERDDGQGSPLNSRDPDVVFEKGTTSEPGSRMGMGLYFVRMVANVHNGQVRLESEPEEKGAHFVLELPKSIVNPNQTPVLDR